ncbi:hypothetical protein ANCCAN_27928 [Ancylostoma caninum]|uniref:Uncharacterized protein n=1 Tax=Ancylostoma caninum TaxID=29170 RepID=A0A368F2M6_ANCCA|nr:hypothetical protein ANCCAN_27928 [Ancylostoma caninum]
MQLDFVAQSAGRFEYKLYFICDSYLGADQEFDFSVKVEGTLLAYLTIVVAESEEEMMIESSETANHYPGKALLPLFSFLQLCSVYFACTEQVVVFVFEDSSLTILLLCYKLWL